MDVKGTGTKTVEIGQTKQQNDTYVHVSPIVLVIEQNNIKKRESS